MLMKATGLVLWLLCNLKIQAPTIVELSTIGGSIPGDVAAQKEIHTFGADPLHSGGWTTQDLPAHVVQLAAERIPSFAIDALLGLNLPSNLQMPSRHSQCTVEGGNKNK